MRICFTVLLCCFAICLGDGFAFGDPSNREQTNLSSWDGLKLLQPNEEIKIYLKQDAEIRARFLGWHPDELYLKRKDEEIRIKRENVSVITAKRKRIDNSVLKGAIVGFGAGTVFGTLLVSAFNDDPNGSFGKNLAAGMGFGMMTAMPGAAIGGLVGKSARETTVYVAP